MIGRRHVLLGLVSLALSGLYPAASQVVISEFFAADGRVLADEDGHYSDWIELVNVGSSTANLEGWSLTDNPDRLRKWVFPATQLPPGGFVLVFASEKDRRVPGQPLHTNFKLSQSGEYLALVEPDGSTRASEYAPTFPPQATGVSYGLPLNWQESRLVPREAPGRFWVPADDALGNAWTRPDFADGAWLETPTGVGFDFTGQPLLVPVADSVEDWNADGIQGYRGWWYGYYNKAADTVAGFQTNDFILFPRTEGPHGPANYWNGAAYRWPSATQPWDMIGPSQGYPNGANSGGEHWVIRRWISPVHGDLEAVWRLAKVTSGGSGVTARLYHNGVLRNIATILGTDTAGVVRTNLLPAVAPGDFIDFALTPIGKSSAMDDIGDCASWEITVCSTGTLGSWVTTPVDALLHNRNASAFLRLPFAVDNPAAIDRLRLRIRYDDGFVAYLNGTEVARRNAPAAEDPPQPLPWNSTATASRSAAEAASPEVLDLTSYRDFLRAGPNILAFHALNVAPDDPDFLLVPELLGTRFEADPAQRVYFTLPTPGAANGPGTLAIGPIISEVRATPPVPGDADPLLITARLSPTFLPVASATLICRIQYGAETSIAMADDGAHGDGLAGDGIYGGVIPADLSVPGQMIRYAIVATDTEDRAMRSPPYPDPINSPEYHGTIVDVPALAANPLPVLHWFIQSPSAANSDTPARSSVFFKDRFYDNIGVTVHGQSTRGFPKKSYDFDFNPGDNFRWSEDAPAVDDFNLLTTWADKSHLRNVLAYEIYQRADCPGHFAFAVRVQQNGAFFSVANLVENGDDHFLERLGLDPDGALYKMYNAGEDTAGAEKKTRKYEGTADLQALITGMTQSTALARQTYMYDHLDLPEFVNCLAARVVTADVDCCHKNHYLYRDTNGSGEWQLMPWDVDLSFGRVWTCGNPCLNYFDETLYTTQSLLTGSGHTVINPVFATPATREMYFRRLRTLMDALLQPPGTPASNDFIRLRSLALRDAIAPDAALDLQKWGFWGTRETIIQAVDRIHNEFLPGRRTFVFRNSSVTNSGELPLPQPSNAFVGFGPLEFRSAAGIPLEEWLSLTNPNAYAVDISGWRLEGGVRFTFKGGTVIPNRSTLYVSPNAAAFRARTTTPKGAERRLVVGSYDGDLSAWGESLELRDAGGRLVATHSYAPDPSPAQKLLRVSELLFHPASLPGDVYDAEEYEFLELENLGSTALDLHGVAFTKGISFRFDNASITELAPGARLLLVKNASAFADRYGPGWPVAGAYTGSLDNAGERLRVEDRFGETILDFSYDDAWHRLADGLGFALATVDPAAEPSAWATAAQWRLNGTFGGTPGQPNAPLPQAPAVVINEILAHTDPPLVDAVELHNLDTIEADLGGWFLTDDLDEPRKFQIPPDTRLAPGEFRVFTEADFNAVPGAPSSFGLGADGDSLWLLSADAAGALTGYLAGTAFGATPAGVSLGRILNTAGEVDYVLQSQLTLGATNAAPRVGPVVFSEIMFHPPPLGTHDPPSSYIELANLGAQPVPLRHPTQTTNTWRLRNAVDFDFPQDTVLPAGGHLIVVGFDPATDPASLDAFRARYSITSPLTILGPWTGGLANDGETIELEAPDTAEDELVPYVLIEKVHYRNQSPWPVEADGLGASLQRQALAAYANEPTNWIATVPSPGAANRPNRLPTVALTEPGNGATYTMPVDVALVAEASDADGAVTGVEFLADGILLGRVPAPPYRWLWTNTPAGSHVLTARALDDRYGTAESDPVTVTIEPAPLGIRLTSPADGTVLLKGSSVLLTAEATPDGAPIRNVRLLAGNLPLADFTQSPYAFTWSSSVRGVYPITAVVTDADGRSATSAVVTVAYTGGRRTNVVLVPAGATWNYLDDGSNQGTHWTSLDFPDERWKTGAAELGYGDDLDGRPEKTRIGYGPDANTKYITSYFRHAFTLDQAADYSDGVLQLLRDDGGIVHVNGTEEFRSNMPSTPVDYLTRASNAASGTEETTYYIRQVTPGRFRNGRNVLAVEIHQNGPTSTDLSFDLVLTANQTFLEPIVLADPRDRLAQAGDTVEIACRAAGTAPLEYQWRFNGTPIAGATADSLQLTGVSPDHAGLYSVTVRNPLGSTVSAPARLTVNQPPVAQADTLAIPVDHPVVLIAAEALANDRDPEGHPLAIESWIGPGPSHGVLTPVGSGIEYRPDPGFSGFDQFHYVVADDQGGRATGSVHVVVAEGAIPEPNHLTVELVGDDCRLRYRGTPGQEIELQRSTDLGSWSVVTSTILPVTGWLEIREPGIPVRAVFYRAVLR